MAIKNLLTNMSDGGVNANGTKKKQAESKKATTTTQTVNNNNKTSVSGLANTLSKTLSAIDPIGYNAYNSQSTIPSTYANNPDAYKQLVKSNASKAADNLLTNRVYNSNPELYSSNPDAYKQAVKATIAQEAENKKYVDELRKALDYGYVVPGGGIEPENNTPVAYQPTPYTPNLPKTYVSRYGYTANNKPSDKTVPDTSAGADTGAKADTSYNTNTGAATLNNPDMSGIYYKNDVANLLSEISNVVMSGRNNYESIYNDLLAGALNTEKAYKEYETAGRNRDADIKANSIENLMKALRLNERSGVHSNSNRGATLANNVQLTNSALQDDNAELSANELERMNKALELSKLINMDTRTSAMNYTNSQLSSIMNVLANYLYGDVASINNANATKYAAYSDYASQLAQLGAMQNYYDSQAALNNAQANLYGSSDYLALLNAYTNSYNKG